MLFEQYLCVLLPAPTRWKTAITPLERPVKGMAKLNASRPPIVLNNEKQDSTSKMMAMLIMNAVHKYKRK
jgi:hypothetical protein